MSVQKAFSFDVVTLKKIGKSCLIAAGGAVLAVLAAQIEEVGAAVSKNPLLVSLITAVASVLVNGAREFIKGQE